MATELVNSLLPSLNAMIKVVAVEGKAAQAAVGKADTVVNTGQEIKRILKGTEEAALSACERATDTAAYLLKINAMTKKLTPVLQHATGAAQVAPRQPLARRNPPLPAPLHGTPNSSG